MFSNIVNTTLLLVINRTLKLLLTLFLDASTVILGAFGRLMTLVLSRTFGMAEFVIGPRRE